MVHPMRAKFGLSLSNRAVLFGWATLDDLIDAAQRAEASGYFHGVWVDPQWFPTSRGFLPLDTRHAARAEVTSTARNGAGGKGALDFLYALKP